MKRFTVILLCFVVSLCLVQACAALTYEGTLETSPTQVNALQPGDSVTVSGIIKLPPSGDQTFDLSDTLEMYTQLEKAAWSASIRINDHDNPYLLYGGAAGRKIILGNDLAYPTADVEVKVSFSVTGSVPSTFKTGQITLFRALELDDRSEQVGSGVFMNGTVFNPSDLEPHVTKAKADVADLKASIDAKANLGVDVTAAMANYSAAKSSVDTAAIKISSSPSEVTSLLASATNSINNATINLDRAWAGYSIKQAQAMIDSVNGLITEFKVNNSLKETDPRLVPIINKYDLAARSLSDAKNSFTQGSYSVVRSDASQSLGYANEAWNLSLSLKEELDRGFKLPGLPDLGALFPFLIIAAVVLIIAGVIIYRRKMHWDELG